MLKRTLKVAAVGAIIAGPVFAWEEGESYTISVAGSAPNQSIYAVGVAHKQIVENALPGVRLEILATQGGNENIELIMAEQAQMANANSISAYSAYNGNFVFEGMQDQDVLGFFPGYTWEIGPVVLADSEFETFRDLIGHSIALGPVGSGAEATVTSAMEAMGLSDDDFERVQRSSPAQAFNSLAAGQVDAVIWGTAHPAGIYLENQATQDLRFLTFTEEDLSMVTEALPFYTVGSLRAGSYEGQDEAVSWIGGSTHFWVNASVPDNLVKQMVAAIWENRAQLESAHSSQQFVDEELVRQQADLVPFHPGAQAYFEEAGILPAE